jgi:hypothetical protein
VKRLQKYASMDPFGKGSKTVYDPTYRKAMEITASPKTTFLDKANLDSRIDFRSAQTLF